MSPSEQSSCVSLNEFIGNNLFELGPVYQSRQWGNTAIHRIEDMAKRQAGRVAVITGDNKTVTYGELVLNGANAIAAELVAGGISTGSRVAVLQESTANWVSSILAIMRVGATYLPLDPGLPWARLAIIVKDCDASAVLVDEHTRQHVGELQRPEMQTIDVSKIKMNDCQIQVPILCTPENVCTILYTSGSSGIPKGIALPHQGIRAWLEPCAMLYGMSTDNEVLLQQSSQGFDMSLMQIFTALCFGGTVYLLARRLRGDARAISEAITRHGITHTYGTPSEYFSWLNYGEREKLRKSAWKTALVGGEQLTRSLLQAFATLGKSDLRFHHMYGTTESTFCATVMELPYDQDPADMSLNDGNAPAVCNYPAGVALPNYSVYVLDELRRPLPAGLQGEIYIGGAGVAQGYLNRPALTAEKFVPDVFATAEDHARGWTMMQRTGDLGRWSRVDQGAILIEGRISGDTMVKLRGLRVDLREVDNALLNAAGGALSEVIVSVRRSSPETPEFLVAHVVFDQVYSRERDAREHCLRQVRASLELPLYMRPAFIIPLDRMPVTPSGKIDRKAVGALSLPEEDETIAGSEDVVWTPVEERLKRVWEHVLNDLTSVKRITPQTDFFHVGGTSLLILNLRDKIKAEFKVELSVVDLFEASVLLHMAHRIEGAFDETEEINWDDEIALRPSMLELTRGPLRPVPYSDEKVVILTGASGYLGKGIVDALIADPTVKEIHCIAVRNASSRTELSVLEKTTVYEGDLTHPRVGLPLSVIDDLFGRAHVIIHNGADTSHLKTYQSLRQCNCLTTKDFVEWSMPRMVPIHYVSTAGIGYFAHSGEALGEFSLSERPPPVDGSMGYDASKWASENFLEQLAKRHPDWPVCVHRPTLISRDDIPELDIAHNLMLYSRKLGAVPTSRVRGIMNVVKLDTVVDGILDCALAYYHPRTAEGKLHFVNHMGNLDLPFGDMRKWALERTGDGDVDFANIDLNEMPMAEWAEKATNLGMHPTVSAFLTSFGSVESARFPNIVKDGGDHE